MFRRRGTTEEEETQHAKVRGELTKSFSTGLKQLQQKQHLDGELIVSNEASNYLCNVLEAIFLHGVKEGVVTRLSSLAPGQNSTDIKTNFWNAVKRVTHRDVVNQLKDLSQISNDVGRCRAWVRLAINDGLMVSYVNSMVSDTIALRSFYYPWAYLMDYEQPGILANHLGGLVGLRFSLSYNSTIFNTWSSTTITLAGLLLNNRSYTPIIGRFLGSSPRESLAESDAPMMQSFTVDTSSSSTTVSRDVAPHLSTSWQNAQVPPNTPCNPSMFNSGRDLEAIKQLTAGSRTSSVGSNSSSQASHPDPGGQASDASVTADHISRGSSKSGSPQENEPSRASPFEAIRQRPREELKREEQRILTEVLAIYDKREEERREKEHREQAEAKEKRIRERMVALEKERKEKFEKERQERLAEQKRLRTLAEQERDKALAKQASQRASLEEQHSKHTAQDSGDIVHKSHPHGDIVHKSHPHSHSSKSNSSHSHHSEDHHKPVLIAKPEYKAEVHHDSAGNAAAINRPSSYGNSLSNMDGWSTESPHHTDTRLEESFESVLKGYQANQGRDHAMATLDDVLDGMEGVALPADDTVKPKTSKQAEEEAFFKVELSDEFDDFEIIHSPNDVLDTCKVEQMKSLGQFTSLSQQNYTCAAPHCNRGVGHFHGPGRVCSFDGKTYCEHCHENQTTYIPAEIVYNWNFKKMKVSAVNYLFLQQVANEPLFDIEELFPHIYSKVTEMNATMLLRTRLTSLRSYMFTCSQTTVQLLKEKAVLREHLYNKIHTYSINDLLDVKSGKLQKLLQEMVALCQGHVYSCGLCIQKGFICEICRDVRAIFPFEIDTTIKCKACKAVFHSKCKTEAISCPKCVRFARRGAKLMKDADDYAISPE